jgi:putative flippase GtrA
VNNIKSRYLLIGGLNFINSFLVFAILHTVLEKRLNYLFILIIAFFINVPLSHQNQRRFVWRSSNPYFPELRKFGIVNIPPFLFNLAILPLLIKILQLPVLLTQLISSSLIVAGIYLVHKSWTFK